MVSEYQLVMNYPHCKGVAGVQGCWKHKDSRGMAAVCEGEQANAQQQDPKHSGGRPLHDADEVRHAEIVYTTICYHNLQMGPLRTERGFVQLLSAPFKPRFTWTLVPGQH